MDKGKSNKDKMVKITADTEINEVMVEKYKKMGVKYNAPIDYKIVDSFIQTDTFQKTLEEYIDYAKLVEEYVKKDDIVKKVEAINQRDTQFSKLCSLIRQRIRPETPTKEAKEKRKMYRDIPKLQKEIEEYVVIIIGKAKKNNTNKNKK